MPTSISGAPARVIVSLSCKRRRTRPSAGLRTSTRERARPPLPAAACARCNSARAAEAFARAERNVASALSSAAREANCSAARAAIRCWFRRASSACASAAASAERAAPTPALISAAMRASRSAGSAGVIAATTCPRATSSPGSNSIRCNSPPTGAAMTNTSWMRVRPSSVISRMTSPRSIVGASCAPSPAQTRQVLSSPQHSGQAPTAAARNAAARTAPPT